jgi:phosphoglycerol transferase
MAQSSARIDTRARPAASDRSDVRFVLPDVAICLAAGVLAFLGATFALELWNVDLDAPFAYLVDGVFYLMVIKAVLDHGWIGENDNLGAPFGQQLWDFPSVNGDALQLAVVKGIGLFTNDPGLVFNLFFLLTFPLTALVAYLVLRALGVSRGSSLVCAVLYALLPFHFERDEHVFFASYYTVPVGCYLALCVLRGTTLVSRAAPRTTALTLVLCVLVGAASTYYAAFTVTLIAIAMLIALLAGGGLRALVSGAATIGAIGVTMVALLMPTLLYWAEHGENNTERRRPVDTEFYSLKLPQLVLPVAGHRVNELAELRQRYDARFGQTEGNSNALGAVTTVGFFVLLGTAITAPVRLRRRPGRLDSAAALTAGLLVVALTGGLAVLFSLYVNPQVRSWNRVSVFIGFLALLAVGLLLDRLAALFRRKSYNALLAPGLLALVLIVGVLDQTRRPDQLFRDQLEAGYRSDSQFFGEIERQLGEGDVFQLPAVRFPEFGSVQRMSDYDHVRGYLHTSTKLRWSYGAQKGRPEDWTAALELKPYQQIAAAAVATGFDGIYVDRAAYQDGALGVEEELRQVLQVEPLVSSDQRLAFYDARPLRRSMQMGYSAAELEALRLATLRPLQVTWRDGFYDPESDGQRDWRWAGPRASVGLAAEGPNRVVRFRALVTTGQNIPYETTVRYPDGYVHRFPASGIGTSEQRDVELRPGINLIEFETTAPASAANPTDPRALHLRLVDPSIGEPAVEIFSPEGLRRRVPLVHYTSGWNQPERDFESGGLFRWMGTQATMTVTRGRVRDGLTLSLPVMSFEQPRTLIVRLGTKELARVTVPADSITRVNVPIPAGSEAATVDLAVEPAAQRAGAGDPRMLALKIYGAAVGERS